jgi:hypothetical protein
MDANDQADDDPARMVCELDAVAVAALVEAWVRRDEPAWAVDEGLLHCVWEHFVRGPYERVDPELLEGAVAEIELAREFLDQHVARLPLRSKVRAGDVGWLREMARLWVRRVCDKRIALTAVRWAAAKDGPSPMGEDAELWLCSLVWEHFLRRPWFRIVEQGGRESSDDGGPGQALLFLADHQKPLVEHANQFSAQYLQFSANSWCTKRRARIDPIGAKLHRATREAVQVLCRERPDLFRQPDGHSWFDWQLVGDPSARGLAEVADLILAIRSAVQPWQLHDVGRIALPRLLRRNVLLELPRLWCGPGPWPGAVIRDFCRALVALAKDDRPHPSRS